MLELNQILKDEQNAISKIVLSKAVNKDNIKTVIRPIMLKGQDFWQVEEFLSKQVFHKNLLPNEMCQYVITGFGADYRQINIFLSDREIIGLASKKGKITYVVNNKCQTTKTASEHNHQKDYLLSEGMDIPVMRDLGIFTETNKVVQAKYDKFKQINRFVEILDDEFNKYDKNEITILDFGCGKSYLTFIVYYYFTRIKNIKAKVIGYDLKEEVVALCNDLSKKYNYENLEFFVNDITKNELYTGKVDMLITLHACDIATDFALLYAIQNKVPYIFSVPCCQHEINAQIKAGGDYDILLSHGLIKERFSALLTDSFRAVILKDFGYNVDVLEFVDFSHSPKNIMLRCKLLKPKSPKSNPQLSVLQQKYGFTQALFEKLYKE